MSCPARQLSSVIMREACTLVEIIQEDLGGAKNFEVGDLDAHDLEVLNQLRNFADYLLTWWEEADGRRVTRLTRDQKKI